MPEVRVTWIDSGTMRATEEWTPLEKLKEQSKIGRVVTRGELLQVRPESLLIGLSEDEDNNTWFGVQEVDRRAIVSVEVLRVRKNIPLDMLDTEFSSVV